MQVNCPFCQSAVTLTGESSNLAVCQTCGESFHTDDGGDDISVVKRTPSPDRAEQESDSTALFRAPPPTEFPSPPVEVAAASPAESQLAARKFIGPYEVIRCIGRGGFGLVFLARHKVHRRQEAVKVPLREKFQSDAALREFLHEAQVAVQLDHPHIVPVYHADFAEDDTPFISMKFIDGTTLAALLRDESWTLPRIIRLLIDVADALHHAHAREVVHRDLKPGNILIDREGQAWVSDFGLALHASEQLKVRGDAAGTLRYSSPEQVRGQSEHMDGRTDIYSFGVILYEVLTGRVLFEGSRAEITDQILRRAPVPPSQRDIRNEVPLDLETLCLACLEKEVSRRPSSMSMVAKSLRNWLRTTDPDLCRERTETRPADSAGPGPRAESAPDVVSARTIAIATQAAVESQEADLTTSPAASADTERTVRAAPAALPRRPKVAAIGTLLIVAVAGLLLKQPFQRERPPLMDVLAVSGAPVRLLNHDVFGPLPIIMPPREANFARIYHENRETLQLDSPAMCAIALGRVEKISHWRLDVSFSKSSPHGGSGACWGLQPVPPGSPEERHTGGEPAWRLQIIWFDYQAPDRSFLRRRVEYFRKIGEQFQTITTVSLGGHAIPQSANPRQDLSLSFHGPHLGQVVWNGNPVPLDDFNVLLTSDLAETLGIPNPVPNAGPFGVVNFYGATTFERVEFQSLGDATP